MSTCILGLAGFNQMYLFTDLSVSATVGLRHPLIFFVAIALNQHQGSPFYFLCHFHLDAAVQTVAAKVMTPGGDY